VDGAVWIPQLRRRPAPGGPGTFKLPATLALHGELDGVPEVPAPLTPSVRRTYRQISYRESCGVGYLEFSFPGGAMSTGQCRRLLAAYRHAQGRPVKVIVLGPPRDFFGNGIHLNVIEAAADPGGESWRNINAIDDLVHAILTNTGQLTVAALAGNAAAGGLMLALAGRPGLVPVRRGAQPALPPDGPARLGVLDLHPAPPRRRGRGGPADQACLPVTPGLGAAFRPWSTM
jgi:putative two-component system hydrogenase maturation factor HypX/HoxX